MIILKRKTGINWKIAEPLILLKKILNKIHTHLGQESSGSFRFLSGSLLKTLAKILDFVRTVPHLDLQSFYDKLNMYTNVLPRSLIMKDFCKDAHRHSKICTCKSDLLRIFKRS